jgi:hypothetical protein
LRDSSLSDDARPLSFDRTVDAAVPDGMPAPAGNAPVRQQHASARGMPCLVCYRAGIGSTYSSDMCTHCWYRPEISFGILSKLVYRSICACCVRTMIAARRQSMPHQRCLIERACSHTAFARYAHFVYDVGRGSCSAAPRRTVRLASAWSCLTAAPS